MRAKGADYESIYQALIRYNDEHCHPALGISEVQSIAESAAKYPVKVSPVTNSEVALTQFALAQSVAEDHRGRLAWVAKWVCWMQLDEVTMLWSRIEKHLVIRYFLQDLKQRREREAELIRETGTSRSQQIKQIERAEQANFCEGALKLLGSLDGMSLSPEDFDKDQMLVGMQNGECYDLARNQVRAIEASDYMTKRMGVAYGEGHECQLWRQSIQEWCCGDDEQVQFLQTWCGYALSGLTEYQAFLFLYGGGKNGKSVYLNVLSAIIKDYAMTMNSSTLMLKSNHGGATGDIARLVGARFVHASELPENKCFDENLIKQLTGGDIITARHLYQGEFSFVPTLKLMISGNHKPIVKGTDYGFWRRVHLVPFQANIKRPDPKLEQKLMLEKAGILNWMLEGWKRYQREGLVVPESIKQNSNDYRADMDIIQHWLDDVSMGEAKYEIPAKTIYLSYKEWSLRNGYSNPMTNTAFGRKIKNYLGEPVRKHDGLHYHCSLLR